MAGLANRVIGDLGALTLNTTTNYASKFQNVLFEVEADLAENPAVLDDTEYPKGGARGARLTWTIAAEDDDGLDLFINFFSPDGTTPGNIEVKFLWKPYTSGAKQASGDCILVQGGHSADESQTRSYEALVQGTITWV